jgi:predicted dehydrogenase
MAGQRCAALARIPGCEIVALCDAERGRAEALATSAGLTRVRIHDSFEQMLGEPIEALLVCLPPFAHGGQVERAAEAGRHVLVEKPIALSRARGQAMVRSIRRAGVVSHVGFHMRSGMAVRRTLDLLASGEAGRPVLFDACYECNALHGPWWRDRSRSGGQVFEQAIHLYDLARLFLGDADTAGAFQANLCHAGVPGYTAEDVSAAALRFASGALAAITATNCAVPGQWTGRFTLVCQHLTAHFETPNRAVLAHTGDPETRWERIDGDTDLYLEDTRRFVAAVRGEGSSACPIEEGQAALRLVEAVVRSAHRGGRLVRV